METASSSHQCARCAERRERLTALERGMSTLYQIVQPCRRSHGHSSRHLPTYGGSSSQLAKQVSSTTLSHSRSSDSQLTGGTAKQQVSMSELEELVQRLVRERDQLAAEAEELHRVVEAARRERVMAIDERDKMLHSNHIMKMTLERNEATLKLVEMEKGKLVARCNELEGEASSLRQALDAASQTRQAALDERAKVIEERGQLKEDLGCLQAERDTLFEEKLQMEADLRTCLSSHLQHRAEMERIHTSYLQMEAVARSLQRQNEVLCGRVCHTLQVIMHRKHIPDPWGFSIEGGRGTEYFSGDPSIVITGLAASSPAVSSLRYGDRLAAVEGQPLEGVTKREAIELLSSMGTRKKLRLTVRRPCPPAQPQLVRVVLPGRWPFGFSYHARYFVTAVDGVGYSPSVLVPGDHIVKVMGCTVDGLRSSQFRKLLKSCRNGLILDVERLPTEHLSLSLPPQQDSERRGGGSEHSAGYHSLPARLHQASLDDDGSLISHSVPSSSLTPLSCASSAQYLTSDRHASIQESRTADQLHLTASSSPLPRLPSVSSPTHSNLSSLSLRQTDV